MFSTWKMEPHYRFAVAQHGVIPGVVMPVVSGDGSLRLRLAKAADKNKLNIGVSLSVESGRSEESGV